MNLIYETRLCFCGAEGFCYCLSNFKISMQINFDDQRSVVGVSYMHGGKSHRVLINNELVLAAGAVNTPQLLMLSGVGDKKELEKLKVCWGKGAEVETDYLLQFLTQYAKCMEPNHFLK